MGSLGLEALLGSAVTTGYSRWSWGHPVSSALHCMSSSPTGVRVDLSTSARGGHTLQPLRYLALREQGAGFGWGCGSRSSLMAMEGAGIQVWEEMGPREPGF